MVGEGVEGEVDLTVHAQMLAERRTSWQKLHPAGFDAFIIEEAANMDLAAGDAGASDSDAGNAESCCYSSYERFTCA